MSTSAVIDFAIIGSVSMAELGIGLMLMRDARAGVSEMADDLGQYFDIEVASTDLAPTYTRMIERRWIEPHPSDHGRVMLTETGERLVYAAFGGIVRLIDEGHQRFEVSLLWSLASRRIPNDDD